MSPWPGTAEPGEILEETHHRKGREAAGSRDSQVPLEGGEGDWKLLEPTGSLVSDS